MTAKLTRTEVIYTVEIETTLEFVDDFDYRLSVVPEVVRARFVDGSLIDMKLIGRGKDDVYVMAKIIDVDGLPNPWRAVLQEGLAACPA